MNTNTQHPFDQLMTEPLDKWTLIDDHRGEYSNNQQVLTLALGANFYFADGHTAEKRHAVALCVNALQKLYGDKLKWCIGMSGREKKHKQFDAVTEIAAISDRAEFGKVCASHDPDTADEYRIDFGVTASWDPVKSFSNLTVRLPAHSQNLSTLQNIFNNCCGILKPVQAFAGLVSAMPWEDDEWQPQEYVLGTTFYGVCVAVGGLRIEKGTYSATWLIALNPDWYQKIGGDAGAAELGESRLSIRHYDGGVILQAGDYPEPLPVENDLPEFWQKYNAWLKPIRNTTTSCFHTRASGYEQHFDCNGLMK